MHDRALSREEMLAAAKTYFSRTARGNDTAKQHLVYNKLLELMAAGKIDFDPLNERFLFVGRQP
jgi:hypothetical protein